MKRFALPGLVTRWPQDCLRLGAEGVGALGDGGRRQPGIAGSPVVTLIYRQWVAFGLAARKDS
jgi:hypothetical protein